jgi:hypothetical protein
VGVGIVNKKINGKRNAVINLGLVKVDFYSPLKIWMSPSLRNIFVTKGILTKNSE